ncbi:transporter [Trichophyton mentagrophytes]|nr:transporter [Trichophyton mentagrophytes]
MAHKQKYCGNGDASEKNFVQSNAIASDLSPGLEDDMVDRAAIYLTQAVEYPPLTPEVERAIVRKIDWIVLPMLLLTATLGAVDKVALGTAALYGLREDLGLKGQTYAWAGSILPIGAIAGMWPSSYLVHRFPSAKYLCVCSIGWSAVTLLIPTCTGGQSLLALRFIMGFLEAIIVPGISLLIAGFYKKREQPPRNAIVFSAFSSVINGFLSYTVGRIPSPAPLRLWQYLFLIVGSVSMAWSIFAFIFLPNSPMDARFLTDEEKYHAVKRLAENKTGIVNKRWKWNQVIEAVLDPKTWIIFLFNVAINIPNGGLITFGGILIKNLGFSPIQASLLNMPTGVMSTLSAFIFSSLAARWANRRCLVTMLAASVPVIGSIIVYTLKRTDIPAQIIGLYFLYTYFGPYVVGKLESYPLYRYTQLNACQGISLAQANTAGHTKKNVQYSILYIGYAVGNLIGPQTFRDSQAPAYTGGFIAMLACYCSCILLMGMYWILAAWMNKRASRARVSATCEGLSVENHIDQFMDKSDFKQVNFKYTT